MASYRVYKYFQVTDRSIPIEAASEEDAIAKADELAGWEWEQSYDVDWLETEAYEEGDEQ